VIISAYLPTSPSFWAIVDLLLPFQQPMAVYTMTLNGGEDVADWQ
jgi:hypothetical protein